VGYFRPVDADEGEERIAEEVPVILFVGRLVSKKGPEILIEAASSLRARGLAFRLELIGDGPLRAALEARIQALGLGDVVSLRGLMVREEVRDAMKRAACFALPCRVSDDGDRDGIPNSLAEAMAAGLAVVSTRLPRSRSWWRTAERAYSCPGGSRRVCRRPGRPVGRPAGAAASRTEGPGGSPRAV